MVILSSHCSRGGLGQIGVGLQGFVKHLHSPPFFVARGDSVIVACQVAAHQVQNSRAVVLVSKDLAHYKDFFCIPLESATHRSVLCKIQFIYANKLIFGPINRQISNTKLNCYKRRSMVASHTNFRNEASIKLWRWLS